MDAFTGLTEGDTFKATAIVGSVVVSPKLIEKHDNTRQTMNDMLQEKASLWEVMPMGTTIGWPVKLLLVLCLLYSLEKMGQ